MRVPFLHHRLCRTNEASRFFERFERGVITLPDRAPQPGDFFCLFKLCEQECRSQLAREIGRAHIDPGVLIDFPSIETASIGSFLPDDLRAFDELRIVDQ